MQRFALFPYSSACLVEITDLWVAAWAATFPWIDFEARRSWIVDRLVGFADSGTDIVCARDSRNGSMAGFITIDPRSGEIDQFAVALDCQGSGAATALLEETKRRCPDGLHLDVNQDNARAVRFYEKSGFRRIAEGLNPTSGLKTWRYSWRAG